jgi:tRNA nucleotidyltransferase (CCA-adding enzyme)
MLSLGFREVGEGFPVFLHPDTSEEYALARSEQKVGPGYAGFTFQFSPDVTLEEDLMRRDLTINAMALRDGHIVDPYGGQADLMNKVLRHTSDAFQEDPVRVLRIARFAARYSDFTIHLDTMDLMRKMLDDGELDSLVPERVWAEFVKGLMEDKPSRMFNVLNDLGAGMKVFREFFDFHPGRLDALDQAAKWNAPLEVRFGIVASGFKHKTDYKKWTVSSDCEELATLVNNNLQSFINYPSLNREERVQLFNRCDMRRRPDRFMSVLRAVQYILQYSKNPVKFPEEIVKDMNAVQSVDGGKIAMSVQDKTQIKEAIFNAQCEAINNAYLK